MILDKGKKFQNCVYIALSRIRKYVWFYLGIENWIKKHNQSVNSFFQVLYVGEGSKREQCCFFGSLVAFNHFLCYPQANWALLVLIPGWMDCVHSNTLWVSPTNFPLRLGVSPTAATPTGFFSQRLWGFISFLWNSGLRGLPGSPVVPLVYPHKCGTTSHCPAHPGPLAAA